MKLKRRKKKKSRKRRSSKVNPEANGRASDENTDINIVIGFFKHLNTLQPSHPKHPLDIGFGGEEIWRYMVWFRKNSVKTVIFRAGRRLGVQVTLRFNREERNWIVNCIDFRLPGKEVERKIIWSCALDAETKRGEGEERFREFLYLAGEGKGEDDVRRIASAH